MNSRKPSLGEDKELLEIEEDHFHDVKSSLIKPTFRSYASIS
jgi:hypothetical protein